MVPSNSDRHQTAFTVSVDAREGTTTGVSGPDRARTIAVLIDPKTRPDDLMKPGHMFPLRARPGGVLERPGHTEAAIDLARLAGCGPAGVIGEIIRDDGHMARAPELLRFARTHGLRIITIADLICYRRDGRDRRPSVHSNPHGTDLEIGAAG
jgi:3,4-dihydroxy 2-butanone 4-phosphate synthase/GTP cyclohydrolase II